MLTVLLIWIVLVFAVGYALSVDEVPC